MKFLRVGKRLINLAQVTDIHFGKGIVTFSFVALYLQANDEGLMTLSQVEIKVTGGLADELRAFFAEHWTIGDVGTFDL